MSKNRILSLVLALVMVLGTVGSVFAETATTEAPATYHEKIQWLIDQNILVGDGTGDYDLDSTITRDVLARFITVAEEQEPAAQLLINSPSGFNDIKPGNWANGYAAYVRAENFMVGDQFNNFNASGVVTYEQAIVALTKVALKGLGESTTLPATGMWYTPYVAKATELGLLDDITPVIGANAKKEDILKVLYNVLNNKEYGNYDVLQVIVLENDRISRLGANEVTVEVMDEVQRANFVDATRASRKGEQRTVELPAKYFAEDLLGKVANFSFDKNGKVVEVKVVESFEVLTGAISNIRASRLTIGGKEYIVNLDERYNKDDERVYRTYLNDKDYKYEDFAKNNESVEYARVTVKAGKVLFIDAFNFDDIRPVKEVKEVRGKDTIVAYDDVRSGGTVETTVSKTRVILVNGKTFTRGTLEDVKADNVLHTYNKDKNYVVLQDKPVVDKLERVSETRDYVEVVVGDKAYRVPGEKEDSKQAVYEFEGSDRFYTLEADDAYKVLDPFRKETVKVLLGLNGKVQYIGSEIEYSDYVGVATRIVGNEVRVFDSAKEVHDYKANLDTTVVAKEKETTGHQNLNKIDTPALVYVKADDKDLDRIIELTNFEDVKEITKRELTFVDEYVETNKYSSKNYRITEDTIIFVNINGKIEARTIAEVTKAYEEQTDKAAVEASLISEKRFDDISIRGNRFARKDHAHAILIKGLDIKPAQEKVEYVKVLRYYDRASGRSEVLVEYANGKTETYRLAADAEEKVNIKEDEYYAIRRSKETENLILSLETINFKEGVVEKDNRNSYVIDGEEYYMAKETNLFGRAPRKGDKVFYTVDDKYRDLVVVVNDGKYVPEATAEGVVTYISGTAIEVDNKTIYTVDSRTILKDAEGKTIGLGLEIIGKLVKGDIIEVENNVITRKVSKVEEDAKAKEEADKKAAAEVAKLVEAIPAEITAESLDAAKEVVNAARVAYEALTEDQKAFVTNLDALEAAEAKIEELEDEGEPEDEVTWEEPPSVPLGLRMQGQLNIPEGMEDVVVKVNGTEVTLEADGSFVVAIEELKIGYNTVTVEVDGEEVASLAEEVMYLGF